MNRKWMEKSLEESVNTCFEYFLNSSLQKYSANDFANDKFESEIAKVLKTNNRFSFPVEISWSITSKCNLRCKHCVYLESDFFDQEQELTTEQIFKIIDEIHEMTTFFISFSGGEALARKDIFDILKYLKKRNVGVSIFSNGVLIDKEIISKLKSVLNPNIDYLNISLDGTKECHDEIRGKGTYDKTINAIKNLINEGFSVNANCTVSSKNLNILPELFNLCAEMGVNQFLFTPFRLYDNRQSYLLPDKELLFKADAEIINLLERYKNIKYASTSISFKRFFEFIDYIKYLTPENKEAIYNSKEFNKQKFLCHPLNSLFYINPLGLVFPCSDCGEGIKTDYFLMGDLKKESLKDIWSRRFDNIILNERSVEDIEGCKDCQYKGVCKGNCPAWTYFKQKSIYKPPAECNVYKCSTAL